MTLSNMLKWKYSLYTTGVLCVVDTIDVDYITKLVLFTVVLRSIMG